MSNKINPNDPAQPINQYTKTGLTIRADFAKVAMSAIVGSIHSEPEYHRLKYLATKESLTVSQWIAKEACKQADALINELNKEV